MLARTYLLPHVVEMNYQAGRRLGVNVYLIDGGNEFVLIDIGYLETVEEIVELIRQMDFNFSTCKVDLTLNEGDSIEVGKVPLQVWHTPGHTAGQLSFKMGNLLFSGDNIYKDSCVGVIDAHHGSNLPDFISSLRRIVRDDAEFLLPSHGPVFRRDKKILQK